MAEQPFDVVVIGGGVVGAGAALDAAARGLSVAVVEQRDWAAGTSSRSSKLIHGGLRYLEQFEFGLVREALRERELLHTRLAPHLVTPVSFLYPLREPLVDRLYVGAGIALYDFIGGARHLPRHRHLTRRGTLKLCPGLADDNLHGAIRYYDCQVDDARHTLAVARTAARFGAAMATSVRATGFMREGERVVGVQATDLESGQELEIAAGQVINATGVWTDDVQKMAGRGRIHVQASKGIHLIVPRDRIASDTGILLRTETSVLFVIPWGRHWIIGTTDTAWELDLAHPAASRADIDYVLGKVNEALAQELTHADVEGVYAGLRPLLSGESAATSALSREHAVSQPVPGLTTVAGGKYTTYRVMAADAVDSAGRGLDRSVPPSPTRHIPLSGADGFPALWNRRHTIAAEAELHVARVEHLLRRHGSNIFELLALLAERPELREPVPGADDYLALEAVYAVTHEGALHLDDVLTRRTHISIEAWDRGLAAAEVVGELMAEVLGWSAERTEREVTHYQARVGAERFSQRQHDDATADAARLGAPDVRRGAPA
ncbi:MAG: glycerol-3-phosphate dehydrogenase/oxidase [Solirubrobacterales bacterium]